MVGAVVDKYVQGRGVVAGAVEGFGLCGSGAGEEVGRWTVAWADGDCEGVEWRELRVMLRARPVAACTGGRAALEAIGERSLARERRHQRLVLRYLADNPGKVPAGVVAGAREYYAQRMRWEVAAEEGERWEGAVDADAARGVARRLAADRPPLTGTPQRVNLLLSLLEPRGGKARGAGRAGRAGEEEGDEKGAAGLSAQLRRGVLKVLADIVKSDPEVLEQSQVLPAVRNRYIHDASALVRAAAVDILAAYTAHSQRVTSADLNLLCTRARDTSSMVRLKVAEALAALLAMTQSEQGQGVDPSHRDEALVRICRLAVDEEAVVRKKSLRLLVEMWLLPGARAGGRGGEGGDKVPTRVVDEIEVVVMHTVREQAGKGASSAAGHDMCLLRRCLLRIFAKEEAAPKSAAGAAPEKNGAGAKGKSPAGRGKGRGGAGGAGAESSVMIGAEDETMDAGGAAAVQVLAGGEREVCEARCRAVSGALLARVLQQHPACAAAAAADSDAEAGEGRGGNATPPLRLTPPLQPTPPLRPTPPLGGAGGDVVARLERVLAALAALLSFAQALPQMVWGIPGVAGLLRAEMIDPLPLEKAVEEVGEAGQMTGLRMQILAHTALLLEAVIAFAPPAALKEAVLPGSDALQRQLAKAANRVCHQGALHALVKCLCTLATRAKDVTVPLLALHKYVDVAASFAATRSARLRPFVSSALLGAGALCRFVDWGSLLAAPDAAATAAAAAARLQQFRRGHARLVQVCVGSLAGDADERIGRCAMQCLGGLLVFTPTLLLDAGVEALVKRSLSREMDSAAQQAVLEAFRVFLEEEDKVLMAQLRLSRPATGAEAVDVQRVSSMSTSVANDYLALILDCAFPRPAGAGRGAGRGVERAEREAEEEAQRKVRGEAMGVLRVIMRRGLTAPSRVGPSLIALTAWDDEVARQATAIFAQLHRKNAELSAPNMIIAGVMDFIDRVTAAAVQVQGDGGGHGAAGDGRCEPPASSAFGAAFGFCANAAVQVRAVVRGLLNLLEKEGRATGVPAYARAGSSPQAVVQLRSMRMELLAHAVASLAFESLDGPLYAIHHVGAQVPMLGTLALQGVDEVARALEPADTAGLGEEAGAADAAGERASAGGLESEPARGDRGAAAASEGERQRREQVLAASCCKGVAAALMLNLSVYLKTAYLLSDAKVRGFKPDGPVGAREAAGGGGDILPPFRPASLVFAAGLVRPDPDGAALQRAAEVLGRLLEDNAVLMGRDSTEAPSLGQNAAVAPGAVNGEEEGGEDGEGAGAGAGGSERALTGGSPDKRGAGSVKDHFAAVKRPDAPPK